MKFIKYIAAFLILLAGVLVISFGNCVPRDRMDLREEQGMDHGVGHDAEISEEEDLDVDNDVPTETDHPEAKENAHPALLSDAGEERIDAEPPENLPPALRWRTAELNQTLLRKGEVKEGDEITLALFPDAEYDAEIDRITEDVNATLSLRGRIKGYQFGYAIITTSADGQTVVNVRIPEKNEMFRIMSTAGREKYYVIEVDREKLDILPPAEPLIPPDND